MVNTYEGTHDIHALILGYWHTIVTPPMVFAKLMVEVYEEMKAKGFGGALICDADGSSQEGNDRAASRLFPQIAKLTRGAYCKFDRNSPDQLKRLLGAVAAYAAGGRAALLKYGAQQGGVAALLTSQMK